MEFWLIDWKAGTLEIPLVCVNAFLVSGCCAKAGIVSFEFVRETKMSKPFSSVSDFSPYLKIAAGCYLRKPDKTVYILPWASESEFDLTNYIFETVLDLRAQCTLENWLECGKDEYPSISISRASLLMDLTHIVDNTLTDADSIMLRHLLSEIRDMAAKEYRPVFSALIGHLNDCVITAKSFPAPISVTDSIADDIQDTCHANSAAKIFLKLHAGPNASAICESEVAEICVNWLEICGVTFKNEKYVPLHVCARASYQRGCIDLGDMYFLRCQAAKRPIDEGLTELMTEKFLAIGDHVKAERQLKIAVNGRFASTPLRAAVANARLTYIRANLKSNQ